MQIFCIQWHPDYARVGKGCNQNAWTTRLYSTTILVHPTTTRTSIKTHAQWGIADIFKITSRTHLPQCSCRKHEYSQVMKMTNPLALKSRLEFVISNQDYLIFMQDMTASGLWLTYWGLYPDCTRTVPGSQHPRMARNS